MSPENITALADSKDVALAISLFFNGVFLWAIRRLYKDNREAVNQFYCLVKTWFPLIGSNK
jgi:hypothetical protein